MRMWRHVDHKYNNYVDLWYETGTISNELHLQPKKLFKRKRCHKFTVVRLKILRYNYKNGNNELLMRILDISVKANKYNFKLFYPKKDKYSNKP